MREVTISSKFKIVISRDVRKQLGFKAGQKLKVVVKGRVINLVSEVPLSEMRGFLKGMDTSGIRDYEDRLSLVDSCGQIESLTCWLPGSV